MLPSLNPIVDQLEPPSVDLSIIYPDTVPSGTSQERLICVVDISVAVSPDGDSGVCAAAISSLMTFITSSAASNFPSRSSSRKCSRVKSV